MFVAPSTCQRYVSNTLYLLYDESCFNTECMSVTGSQHSPHVGFSVTKLYHNSADSITRPTTPLPSPADGIRQIILGVDAR